MFSTRTSRGGLRGLAAAAGIAATLLLALGTTAAQASTVQASTVRQTAVHQPATARTAPPRTHLVHIRMGKRGHDVRIAAAPYPSNCSDHDATCTYNSGWQTYNNGGCEEDTTATWDVLVNMLVVSVSVQSPYLFAGCTAYGTVYFGTNSGPTYSVGDYYAYACAVLDPTCSDNQTWSYQTLNAVPTSEQSNINSIWTSAVK